MLEGKRIIVTMILALNLFVLFWRLSLQEDKMKNSIDSKIVHHYGNMDIHMNEQLHSIDYVNKSKEENKENEKSHISFNFFNLHKRDSTQKDENIHLISSQEINRQIDGPHKLIDLLDFKYELEQPPCDRRIRALIVVHSAPKNSKKRQLIRETWGGKDFLQKTPVRVLFFLGMVLSIKLQKIVMEENKIYDDIVQGNFQDDYRNMTYKHVMALKWYLQNCKYADFLIKVDDDVFVNTPLLLEYIRVGKFKKLKGEAISVGKSESKNKFTDRPEELLFCDRNNKAYPKRTYRSKWRVSFQEYAHKYYPPYCPGYAIVYSTDVVERLYKTAQTHNFFWIDDVLITGILAQINGIDITTFSNYILTEKKRRDLFNNKVKLNELEFLFTTHDINFEQVRALWKLIELNKSTMSIEQFPKVSSNDTPV